MARFHVNPTTGEAGKCSATTGPCPFGGQEDHHGSLEAARQAYEAKMGPAFPRAQTYREEAVRTAEALHHLRDGAEDFEGPGHELHRRLASLESDLVDLAHESASLADGEEKASWERVEAHAAYRQASHERVALQLLPKEDRRGREDYRVQVEEAKAREGFAREAYVAVRVQPAYSDAMAVELAQKMYQAETGGEKSFLDLPFEEQNKTLAAAHAALLSAEMEDGNPDLAAVRMGRAASVRSGEAHDSHGGSEADRRWASEAWTMMTGRS